MRKLSGVVIASLLYGLLLFSGCGSTTQPSVADTNLLPLSASGTSVFSITAYDSINHFVYENGTMALSNAANPSFYGVSYAWDSTIGGWETFPFEGGCYQQCPLGLGIGGIAYVLDTTGSGNGILCGYDYADSGLRYWFRLPQHSTVPLLFSAKYFNTVYNAEVDLNSYQVNVPAGSFTARKLVLRAVTEDSAYSLKDLDTLFLVPGKGLIKFTCEEKKKIPGGNGVLVYSKNSHTECELTQ